MDITDSLFHFTKAETAINYILKNNTIRFNSFKYVNDPKESKEWPFQFYGNTWESHNLFFPELYKNANEFIKEHWLTACFAESLNEELEIFKNMKMWDSYGNNHKGVCLIFSKKKLKEVIERNTTSFNFSGNVIYQEESVLSEEFSYVKGQFMIFSGLYFDSTISWVELFLNPIISSKTLNRSHPLMIQLEVFNRYGIFNYMKWHTIHYNKELFFSKSLSWKDEQEHRFIIYTDEIKESIDVKFEDALKAVILGIDIDDSEKEQIVANSYDRYDVYQLKSSNWNTSLFKVNDEQIFDIGLSYQIDIPQKYLIAPINSSIETEFLFFNWETGDISILPKNN
ncbi:DUF2971 domain-containing protein [Enterococcus faecium]